MKKPPFHFVPLPLSRSSAKPRASGRTMMIDDGLPLAYVRDLVALAGDYVDLAKIKTGTARFYPRELLVRKLRLYKKSRIQPFLGGQFHEYVFATQGEKALPKYYAESLALGFEADPRDYDPAAAILNDIGVRSIRLLTNNPLKVKGLRDAGVVVNERIAHWVGENQHNASYLAVKRRKMGHHPEQPVRLRALSSARKS